MSAEDKLNSIRNQMSKMGIDGFYVPSEDEFQGEYLPKHSERLKYISGFSGSAGSAIILKEKAGFFTDGRYTIQARDEVNSDNFEICSISADQAPIPTIKPTEWIEKNITKGSKFGIDPWMHSGGGAKAIKDAVEKAGGTLVFLDSNPLDNIWADQPEMPLDKAFTHLFKFTGKDSSDKRAELSNLLKEKDVDRLVLTMPEDICWLLNVRGNDVPCTPFALSYAIVDKEGGVDWFIDKRKITPEVEKWLGADIRIHEFKEFAKHIEIIAKKKQKIWIDPALSPAKLEHIVTTNGGDLFAEKTPVQLMKSRKNSVEIKGAREAHIRDGVAMVRFLTLLDDKNELDKLDELSAAKILEEFRSQGDNFKDLSFETISGSGANGAIVHYSSNKETNQPLTSGPIYLVDSGAQYLDGTTDITRTIAVGKITDEMKEHFTRVLKGHIGVANSKFNEDETGNNLDEKARASLKEVGLDFAHGTGHGVGSYLSVHEGPCGISPRALKTPLEPGMIVSNEPGFYKEGAYGIRIESLVTVIDSGKKDSLGKKMFHFETLTLVPIDPNLIDVALLTDDELQWLNDYHELVRKTIIPLLDKYDSKVAGFLKKTTKPLKKTPEPKIKNKNVKTFKPK